MRSRTFWRFLLAAVVGCVHAQTPALPAAGQDVRAFDVVSIKPSLQNGYSHTNIGPDAFEAGHFTAEQMIYFCYSRQEGGADESGVVLLRQLAGLPRWAQTQQFDLVAKVDAETANAFAGLSFRARGRLYQQMLRPVLKERMHLVLQEAQKQQPVFLLQVAPGGSRMQVSTTPAANSSFMSGPARLQAKGYSTEELAEELSQEVDRVVLDRTKLSGVYDYALHWRPVEAREDTNDLPSIFTALEEQLGLRLVAASAPIEVLTVTHIEPPAEN